MLAAFTQALTGIESRRVDAALGAAVGLNLPTVSTSVSDGTVDGALAAVFLIEGMALLEERGVRRERLINKLRTSEFWSTWTEIRVAAMICEYSQEEFRVEIEPEKSRGAHPDWGLRLPGSSGRAAVEVKAVGLSDSEVDFCRRMAPSLRRAMPRTGLVTIHAGIAALPPKAPGSIVNHSQRGARGRQRRTPAYLPGLRGVTIVAHGTAAEYARRAAKKIESAVRQMPEGDACYVAIPWTNGASLHEIAAAIRWDAMPERVLGLIVAGAGVAFPMPVTHCFLATIERDNSLAELQVESIEEDMTDIAPTVFDRFGSSSGVRATLLQVGKATLVHRLGERRIDPFNFLVDRDPESHQL